MSMAPPPGGQLLGVEAHAALDVGHEQLDGYRYQLSRVSLGHGVTA